MKKIISIAVIIAMIATFGTVSLIAGAATVTVPSGGDLQAAISSATTGDVIDLGGNSFTIAGGLNVDKGVTIKNGTIDLVVPTAGVGFSAVYVSSADPVVLSGLTINGFDGAADASGTSYVGCINILIAGAATDVTVSGCTINVGAFYDSNGVADVGTGIETTAGCATKLTVNNDTKINGNNSQWPIYINPTTNFVIDGNTFSGTFMYQLVADSSTGTISNNTFDQCASTESSPAVGFIKFNNYGAGLPSVAVTGNTFIPDPNRDPDTEPQFAVVMSPSVGSDTTTLEDFSGNVISGLMPDSTGMVPVISGPFDPGAIAKSAPNDLPFALDENGKGYFEPVDDSTTTTGAISTTADNSGTTSTTAAVSKPDTGDTGNIAMLLLLCCGAALTLMLTVVIRKKKNFNN